MSFFDSVALAPPDVIFNLTASYQADPHPKKVNLGVGAYRSDQGLPWVLPVVQKAKKVILTDSNLDHEYLNITGLPSFTRAAAQLILGENSPVLQQQRYFACQTLSGTGANSLAALFLAQHYRAGAVCLISKPTWANHRNIYTRAGFKVQEYAYWNAHTLGLDLAGMLKSLEEAPNGSIVILHTCAHNPTGVDPTQDQWKAIAKVIQGKGHVPLFDTAYQGFASGDVDRDAWPVRYFVEQLNMEVLVAQSFAKNFGLYGERAGCLTIVAKSAQSAKAVGSQLSVIVRGTYSNPPAFGARIVSHVLNDPALRSEWYDNLKVMSSRITLMRKELRQHLERLGTPGKWNHVTDQIGMFSFTGLNSEQVKMLRDEYHVYMTENGRISMAGLNSANVEYFAKAVDHVIRHSAKL